MRAAFAVLVALTMGVGGCVLATHPTDPGLAFVSFALVALLGVGLAPPEDS